MFKPSYLSWLICIAMLPLSGCDQKTVANAMGAAPPAATSPAAATPPAAAPAYTPLSADQLYQLVSPVALFPDKLLAQVLAGAGYPDQISTANNWLAQNPGLQPAALTTAADAQPWDPSVRGLVQFPDVLDQMAKNIPWTTALGSAYLNDPTDVMNAIQVMRQRAATHGTLKTSPQQNVIVTPTTQYVEQQPSTKTVVAAPAQTIVIEPSQPNVVYVPRYDPSVVYGAPVPVYPSYTAPGYSSGDMVATGVLSFGVGIVVGALINENHHDDWDNWDVHWDNRRQPVVYNNRPYVSHSTTVINRVTNINQFDNGNRSNTVNNYRNTPVVPAPRIAAPTARTAPNVNTLQQPRFAQQAATVNTRQPIAAPNFTHTGTTATPRAVSPAARDQPQMTLPKFSSTAPAAVPQQTRKSAAPVQKTEKRPTQQPKPRTTAHQAVQQVARPAATKPVVRRTPEAPVSRPQPIKQRSEPPRNPFHQQQAPQAERRPAPAVRQQERRPLRTESRRAD